MICQFTLCYKAYRIRKAIIRANSPSASVKANPSIAEENSSCFYEGFLEVPVTRAAKIKPTPTAAPPNAIVAKPAPINLAAIYIFISYLLSIPNLSMINPYKWINASRKELYNCNEQLFDVCVPLEVLNTAFTICFKFCQVIGAGRPAQDKHNVILLCLDLYTLINIEQIIKLAGRTLKSTYY
ncbi:hypothetical protein HDU92_008502 [Lobulomyces angularis]|nr:hypothetical protein HDU92_008502 [Lobulomyces angularis]